MVQRMSSWAPVLALTLIAASPIANAFVVPGSAPALRGGQRAATGSANLHCSVETPQALTAKIDSVKSNAKANVPFSDEELDSVIKSLKSAGGDDGSADWTAIRELLSSSAHQKHTDWVMTEEAGKQLSKLVGGPDDAEFQRIFARVLKDGNWDGSASSAKKRTDGSKPWAVLVTGVNGIRKTSTIYQPWFKEVLSQALAEQFEGSDEELPTGSNSFFRQLDYIIATVANEEFRKLYELEDIPTYAAVKDSIFARYRTAAEMVGALLVQEARQKRMNVMVETSGRDIGMYAYVDHFFPDDEYNKLVIHFTVNDIAFAEDSVDARMVREMRDGQSAIRGDGGTAAVIQANAGGPYGSQVLRGVESESNAVWERLQHTDEPVAKSWFKASLAVAASDSAPWTVRTKSTPLDAAFPFTPLQ